MRRSFCVWTLLATLSGCADLEGEPASGVLGEPASEMLAEPAEEVRAGPAEEVLAEQILYRGQMYRPEELRDQDLQHWAIDADLAGQRVVAAFDSAEESIRYLSRRQLEQSGGVMPLACDENAYFYDGPYYGYPYFYFTRGTQESNLGDISWNDRIHSLRTPSCPSVTVLYEHGNFGGSSLSFGHSSNVDSLADYKISTFHSWKDKTSSIKVVGNMYYSASNTSSATQNTTNQTVQLVSGQTINVGTCNVPSSYGSGDTYLRLYGPPTGGQLKYSDDACGYLSHLQHTATASGAYEIRAGCFSSGSCSGMVAYTFE